MPQKLTNKEIYTVFVLFYVNILNYMDRYTVAGILGHLKEEFQIGDDLGGLLQTAFVMSYTVCAPFFGYIGDRYSRREILAVSVLIWEGATLIGSFTTSYRQFFFMRLFVGIGEASFSAIAPTLICDVTYVEVRKRALALFYLAIPIGGGMGFAVGSGAAHVGGHWSWGLRVTPTMGAIGSILLVFIKDPVRGERERMEEGKAPFHQISKYTTDLKNLARNRSYLLSTIGFTSVTFVTGALSWWGPIFLHLGFQLIPGYEDKRLDVVAYECGLISILAGIIGVPLGGMVSFRLTKLYPAVDPLICGVVLIMGDPLIITALIFANRSVKITYMTIFIGETCMNCTWTIVADILLSVVVPESRSTAEALQIACGHALGDAGSPFLVGLVAERYMRSFPRKSEHTEHVHEFQAMRVAFSTLVIMQLIGGLMFVFDVFYILEDKEKVRQAIANASRRGTVENQNVVA